MKYSFVVPIYKDAALAEDFCVEFRKVFRVYLRREDIGADVELIFVNDGSPDVDGQVAAEVLDGLAARFDFVRVIELSRNFGQHIAVSAGYHAATGDYVGMLNVDMEDPPDQIPLLLDEIRKGEADLVTGTRAIRHSPWHIRFTSWLFNWLLVQLTGYEVPLNTATLRVMNRTFVDAYNGLTEKSRYIPGLEMWLGFKRAYVAIRHQARTRGQSAYTFGSRLRMTFETVISFSDLPLRIMVMAGTVVATIGVLLTVALIIGRLVLLDFQPGYTSTVSLLVLFGGGQIMVVGLASLYIGRILREVQGRPLYIVRRRTNFRDTDDSLQPHIPAGDSVQ